MTNKRNINVVLALWFSAASLIAGICTVCMILFDSYYFFSLTNVIIPVMEIVGSAGALLLLMGIIKKQRALLVCTGALCAVYYGLLITLLFFKFAESGNYIFNEFPALLASYIPVGAIMSIGIITFVMAASYSYGERELKPVMTVMLTITFFISLITMSVNIGLIAAAYVLLIQEQDVFDLDCKVSIPKIILLSVLTLGVYYVVWIASVLKKTALVTEQEFKKSSVWCYVLFMPYRVYWNYTRGEELSLKGQKDRSVIYMALGVIALSPVVLALIQRELNLIAKEPMEAAEEMSVESGDVYEI